MFPVNVGITYCTLGWWQGVGGYEPATWRTIKRYLQRSDVFWDVGSNIGLYAVLAKKLNPSLRIEALEPVPSLAEANRKFQLANQTGVAPRQVAASSHGDGAEIAIPKYADVTEVEPTATLEEDVNLSPGAAVEKLKVETITLDVLAKTLKSEDRLFIKIDVEGHENHVLQGGRALMESHRPVILCEILPGVAKTVEIANVLTEVRYALWAVCREGLFRVKLADMDKRRNYTDYLLLPDESVPMSENYFAFEDIPF
jgi:FkbM family methyltransferase